MQIKDLVTINVSNKEDIFECFECHMAITRSVVDDKCPLCGRKILWNKSVEGKDK